MKNATENTATVEATPATAPAVKVSAKPAPAKASKGKTAKPTTKASKPAAKAKAVRITGKIGAIRITGEGTIADLSEKLSAVDSRNWENPTTTALVNGLVVMGGAKKIGNRPNPDKKRGRTAAIYAFDAKIG